MKIATIALAATMMATSTMAADFMVAGQTLSVGGEVDTNYNTGTEEWSMEFIPEVGVTAWGVDFSASTTFDVLELNDGDVFEGFDLEAGYSIAGTGLRVYGEIGTDADLEFGDMTTGISFKF
jgi:S-adenosylmethionine synthetase